MPADSRPRRLATAALTVALAALLAACAENPNSVFHSRTDFNREVGSLFKLLIWLGTIVFVFTEAMLLIALVKFRSRPGVTREPEQVHGNTKLEILWTLIPAVVLAIIAVPTVRTIFRTQGAAPANALEVEVIGHQWWWEFRYPQLGVVTANELYLPIGRPVDFALKTHDVLHSFWIPGLGGKRDLVNNRTNHLWFTPDSTTEAAFNGFCAEYCGMSHANMRFRAFTVTPEQFDSWVAHQGSGAAYTSVSAAPAAAPATPPGARSDQVIPPGTRVNPNANLGNRPAGVGGPSTPSTGPVSPMTGAQGAPSALQAGFVSFARDRMPSHTIPQTPIPPNLTYDTALVGNPANGEMLVTRGSCIGCHAIKGVPGMVAEIGPNLTHVASRLTIGGGLFPNDTRHLASWVKNARAMKPGVAMLTLGKGQYDPVLKATMGVGLTDQQIADVVAYLQSLK
ncbi:MAG TPA: cytochrome c oxidase subunit II [Gemmatimonadaceae bacterium]|nr:cytochrome c oxidase subunit II [Gemmatimonadaceae bacterium]